MFIYDEQLTKWKTYFLSKLMPTYVELEIDYRVWLLRIFQATAPWYYAVVWVQSDFLMAAHVYTEVSEFLLKPFRLRSLALTIVDTWCHSRQHTSPYRSDTWCQYYICFVLFNVLLFAATACLQLWHRIRAGRAPADAGQDTSEYFCFLYCRSWLNLDSHSHYH